MKNWKKWTVLKNREHYTLSDEFNTSILPC